MLLFSQSKRVFEMQKRVRLFTAPIWGVIVAGSLVACSGNNVKEEVFDYNDSSTVVPPQTTRKVVPPPPQKPSVRIALRDDVPAHYIVKKGDTLWDISSLFLRDPWLWPEIWYFNPQIDNPHLIYPGDILILIYVDGKPQLRLSRDGMPITQTVDGPSVPANIQHSKLEPKIRSESLEQAIPTIPISAIEPFLSKPRVISKEELNAAPYIISSLDSHLISATGNTIYARNLDYNDDVRYSIYRPGRIFTDPKTKQILGYETTLVSEAKLAHAGKPATLTLTRSIRETLNGDRILPAEKGRISYNFVPHPPAQNIRGEIIALIDAITHTAQRQVVVINIGDKKGLDVGTVLAIDQVGEVIRDPFAKRGHRRVKLPDTRAGLLMIFRVFENVSYGLIVDSTRTVHLLDRVRNPTSSGEIINR